MTQIISAIGAGEDAFSAVAGKISATYSVPGEPESAAGFPGSANLASKNTPQIFTIKAETLSRIRFRLAFYAARCLYCVGDLPKRRRNARTKLEGWRYPTVYATSLMTTSVVESRCAAFPNLRSVISDPRRNPVSCLNRRCRWSGVIFNSCASWRTD